MTATTNSSWAAGKLRGVTPAAVDGATAGFTRADWLRLYDEYLGIIAVHMLGEVECLGVDMDEDPVAVFCHLYLKSDEVLFSRPQPAGAVTQ